MNMGYLCRCNCQNFTFSKYKKFSVLIFTVFTTFRVFPICTSVDRTVYLYGKNVLYYFYNIAQEYKITSMDERREIFRVYISELYHIQLLAKSLNTV